MLLQDAQPLLGGDLQARLASRPATAEELDALGLNSSETHHDLMIGTDSMRLIGACADGSEVVIMENGMFVDAALE